MMSALKSEAAQPRAGFAEVRPAYLESLRLVERLHRRLLDVIKDEFDRARPKRRQFRASLAAL
jgi:hypothetical protein